MATQRNTTVNANLLTAVGALSAGNDIIIQDSATTYTSGDLSGVELSTFTVARTFRGQLGVPGTAIKLNLSAGSYTGLLTYDGTNAASAYFDAETEIQKAVIIATGRGTFYCTDGTWTQIDARAGKIEVGGSAVLVTGNFDGGDGVLIEDNGTAVTTLTAKNTTFSAIRRALTTATFRNCGVVPFDNYNRSAATLTLEDTTMEYNGGNITALTVGENGVMDFRHLSQSITVTNWTLHPTAKVLHPAGFTVTYSNAPTLIAGGPEWYQ